MRLLRVLEAGNNADNDQNAEALSLNENVNVNTELNTRHNY